MNEVLTSGSFDLDLYLKQSEIELKTRFANTFYDAGKKFKEVRETLQDTDIDFYKWCVEKFGFSPQSVLKCIKYYETYEQYPMLKKGLSNDLVLEFGKPDTGEILQKKVIKGEIKTAKELRETKRELNQIKPEYISLKAESERWKIERKKLYADLERVIDIKSELEQKLGQSETRNQAEFKSIIIDIASFMGEKVPIARSYLQKMDSEIAQKAIEGAIAQLVGIINLLYGGEENG